MKKVAIGILAIQLLGGGVPEGNRAYRQGDPRRAAEIYAARLERGDTSAVVRYNLGTALLRMGRHDEARELLGAAVESRGRPAVRARAAYNAGNADLDPVFRNRVPQEQRVERLERAVTSYKRALLRDPGDGDAKWNLELAQRMLEQERRSGGQSPQEDQNGGGGQGGPPQPSPAQGQPDPSPSSQGRNDPQLSEAEAERILSGAERQERNSQREVLRRNQGTRQATRDW
ncbi:MAG TPA: tetratricopeptide repeat protein [Longimicrobium sp.]|nr:tetratricopeptide repeat protein [Longimicrobium sp.]